jgi:outer membrane murein-binding lipoprotein Lpp
MSAQPSLRPPNPRSSRRAASRRSPRSPYRAAAIEGSMRLGVNLVLGIVAISALVRLLPYNLAQQQRLNEIRSEVAKLDQQVDQLRAEFNRHFDPQQTMHVMQEQSARVNPNQRQIIWLSPSSTTAREADPQTDQQQAFSLKRNDRTLKD